MFPIPEGLNWRDEMPVTMSGAVGGTETATAIEVAGDDAEPSDAPAPKGWPRRKKVGRSRLVKRVRGPLTPGGLWFADDIIEVEEHYLGVGVVRPGRQRGGGAEEGQGQGRPDGPAADRDGAGPAGPLGARRRSRSPSRSRSTTCGRLIEDAPKTLAAADGGGENALTWRRVTAR